MFQRCFPFMLIILILSGCRPRPSAPVPPPAPSQLPGPSPRRAAARAAMKPPSPAEALLIRIRNENPAVGFVRPSPVTFTWRDAKGAELSAAGAEIAALVKVETDYTALHKQMQTVADFLIREGFARDPSNTTEILEGLSSGYTVANIRGNCPDGGGDCMLTVRVGNLKK